MQPASVPVPVAVHAVDAISRAGVQSLLSLRPEVRLAGPDAPGVVHVMVADQVDDLALARLRRLARRRTWVPGAGVGVGPVLVVSSLDQRDLAEVLEAGAAAVVWRHEATGGRLARVIRAVAGGDRSPLPPVPVGSGCSGR